MSPCISLFLPLVFLQRIIYITFNCKFKIRFFVLFHVSFISILVYLNLYAFLHAIQIERKKLWTVSKFRFFFGLAVISRYVFHSSYLRTICKPFLFSIHSTLTLQAEKLWMRVVICLLYYVIKCIVHYYYDYYMYFGLLVAHIIIITYYFCSLLFLTFFYTVIWTPTL